LSTVVVGEQAWLTEIIERRHALGQDTYDEVWEGVYHVAPNAGTEHAQVGAEVLIALASRARRLELVTSTAFNLGTGRSDYRVPDGGLAREAPHGTYAATALVVLEVVSPDDETYDKFAFYSTVGSGRSWSTPPAKRSTLLASTVTLPGGQP